MKTFPLTIFDGHPMIEDNVRRILSRSEENLKTHERRSNRSRNHSKPVCEIPRMYK